MVDRILAGKYRLGAELGRGGMGVVHRGEHVVTGRAVAIKLLRADVGTDETLRRRFLREAKAAASLAHPNVVSILDYGVEDDGTAFQVLELLEGETLRDRLERGILDPERALAIALPILHALAAAHERGVIHRDLKPDNVFLAKNAHGRVVPKLLDFGIAKTRFVSEAARDTQTTEHGTVLGTPAYMSPEQARGAEVGASTDIWAIAVLLFRCVSGRLPFDDENASIAMARVMLERAPSLTVIAPDVPRALALAIDQGLAHEIEARPANMRAFVEVLRAGAKEAGLTLPDEDASDCPAEPVGVASLAPRTPTPRTPARGPMPARETETPRASQPTGSQPGTTVRPPRTPLRGLVWGIAGILASSAAIYLSSRGAPSIAESDAGPLTQVGSDAASALIGARFAASGLDASGMWHTTASPADGRGAGSWEMLATQMGSELRFVYGHGNVMACRLEALVCTGTWEGRTGTGWFEITFRPSGDAFAGTWGYGTNHEAFGSFVGMR